MGYPRRKARAGASYTSFVALRACESGGNLSLDSIAKQVDHLDCVRNVAIARNAKSVI